MSSYDADDLQRLEPGYLGHYGLSEAPFSSILQDKFMFLDAERAQRINMLQHMVRYSNLLLIVQGQSGVGKTALMRRFLQTSEEDWQVSEVTANTMIDAEQLLFQAAQGFGVRQLPQDASELQDMLYAKVATFHHNDQIPILIIDDAHELPKDALLAIFNLSDAFVNDVNLLRIILFCEPQIEKIINSKDVRSLRERVTHTMEVPALNEDATAEYLKHRLAVAGFNGGSPFTPKIIKKIYRGSNGIPAKINTLAHEFLEQGDANTNSFIEPDMEIPPERMLEVEEKKQAKPFVIITVMVILVAMVLVFQDEINSIFKDDDVIVALVDEDVIEENAIEENTIEETTTNSDTLQIVKELDIKEKIISLSDDNVLSNPENTVPAQTQSTQSETTLKDLDKTAEESSQAIETATEETITPPPVSAEIISISPNPVPISRKQQTITINGTGFRKDSRVTISWTGKQKQLARSQTKVISDTQIQIAITVGLDEDDWGLKISDPDIGESNAFIFKVADTQVDEGYRKDKWLLAQNPAEFILQLFGTNKKENADQFINEHKIGKQAGYFYTRNKGQDWYSVVYGQYRDQASANVAARSLPKSLKKIKPWVRRLDDIQASINANRNYKVANKPKAKPAKATSTKTKSSTTVSSTKPRQSGSTTAKSPTDKAWLWSQDPSNYTLQLLGARQSDSVKKFLRKYTNLNGKAVYFHTRHDTRDWYTVVYGVYPDRSQAAKAIKRLPNELQKASPWIRSFGSIHAELDRTE